MNANIQALIEACERLGIRYESLHKSGNLVLVHTSHPPVVFANLTTPINSQSIDRLCRDKDYSYQVLSPYVKLPKTISFLDPIVQPKYPWCQPCLTYEAIVEQIEVQLDYPFILKRNSGSYGSNVFVVEDRDSLISRLAVVFDEHSKHYDSVVLAQEKVQIQAEYRVVFYNGMLIFAYLKDITNAQYEGNLSPLHWNGAKATPVTDPTLLERLTQFVRPGLAALGIRYAGVDVALDQADQLWLIEVNSSPSFGIYSRDCGLETVVKLFSLMLTDLSTETGWYDQQ